MGWLKNLLMWNGTKHARAVKQRYTAVYIREFTKNKKVTILASYGVFV